MENQKQISVPEAVEAEQMLIGVCIRKNISLDEINSTYSLNPPLSVGDFFEPKHREIVACFNRIKQQGYVIDETSVLNAITNQDIEHRVYINSWTTACEFRELNREWVERIIKTAAKRRLISHAKTLLEHAQDPNLNPDDLLAFAEGNLKTLTKTKKPSLVQMDHETLDNFDRKADKDSVIGKFRWLCKGGSMLLVSQSGVGKSSFAMQFIISLCTHYDKGFFGIKAQRPLRVVLLQAENDLGDVAESFQDIKNSLKLTQEQLSLLKQNLSIYRDTKSVGKEFIKTMSELIKLHQADVFVVDPLLSFAGIEVSDQKEMTEFLRHGVARVLEETGAILLAVHHTTKPKNKDNSSVLDTDLAYAGAGASELVNYVREVGVLQRAPGSEPIFKFSLTKRRSRSGMTNIDGEFTHEIYVRHSRKENEVIWERSLSPDKIQEAEKQANGFKGK